MTKDCIFCQIASRQKDDDLVFEDEEIVAFRDIHPKAPVHFLIVPKEHIESINELGEKNKGLVERMVFLARKLAEEYGVSKSGYRLIFNVGRGGGQIIDHLHLHLIGGTKLDE